MTRRWWAHVALAAVGAIVVVWVLTVGANPTISCREVVMHPGDTCSNAEGTRVQTYQERYDAAQQARPVIGGVGALVAAFGAGLAVAEVRRAGSSGRTRPDRPAAA